MELEEEAKQLDRNSIAQLAGDDPKWVVQAGKDLQHRFAAIDLNLGCPQNCARRGNYGAWLLPDKERVIRVLTAMVEELDVPITAKIRVFDDDEETIALAKAIQDCGVQMLTVHGRTVKATKLYAGAANWDIIRKIKEELDIPIIANGGISCKSDADRCLAETGADGVMSSEALLENPKLFSAAGERNFADDYARSQIVTAREYLDTVAAYPFSNAPVISPRGHLFCILHRYLSGARHSELRETLAHTATLEDMYSVIDHLEESLATIDFDSLRAIEQGMLGKKAWYFRHRDESRLARIIQPKGGKVGSSDGVINTLSIEERKQQIRARLSAASSAKLSSIEPSS
jgi:tRNA-dihydrouridine synthase